VATPFRGGSTRFFSDGSVRLDTNGVLSFPFTPTAEAAYGVGSRRLGMSAKVVTGATLLFGVGLGLYTVGCECDCEVAGAGGTGGASTVSTSSGTGGAGGATSSGGTGCEVPCVAGEHCVDGTCMPLCGPLTDCGGTCRDTKVDPHNCGACDSTCALGEVCSEGQCCASGQLACGGACTDVTQNRQRCGGCNTACSPKEACVKGACVTECPEGFTLLAGACASVVGGAAADYTDDFGGAPESCDADGKFPFVAISPTSHLTWLDPGGLGAPTSVTLEFERGAACASAEMKSTTVSVRLNGGAETTFDSNDLATDCACSTTTPLLVTLALEPKDLFLGHVNDVTLTHSDTFGLHLGGQLGDALFRVTVAY